MIIKNRSKDKAPPMSEALKDMFEKEQRVIATGPQGGRIVGYTSDRTPIYAGKPSKKPKKEPKEDKPKDKGKMGEGAKVVYLTPGGDLKRGTVTETFKDKRGKEWLGIKDSKTGKVETVPRDQVDFAADYDARVSANREMPKKEKEQKIAQEYEDGADYEYLASKYGVSKPEVLNIVENERKAKLMEYQKASDKLHTDYKKDSVKNEGLWEKTRNDAAEARDKVVSKHGKESKEATDANTKYEKIVDVAWDKFEKERSKLDAKYKKDKLNLTNKYKKKPKDKPKKSIWNALKLNK